MSAWYHSDSLSLNAAHLLMSINRRRVVMCVLVCSTCNRNAQLSPSLPCGKIQQLNIPALIHQSLRTLWHGNFFFVFYFIPLIFENAIYYYFSLNPMQKCLKNYYRAIPDTHRGPIKQGSTRILQIRSSDTTFNLPLFFHYHPYLAWLQSLWWFGSGYPTLKLDQQ